MRQYCLLYLATLYNAGALPLSFYLCLVWAKVYRQEDRYPFFESMATHPRLDTYSKQFSNNVFPLRDTWPSPLSGL